MTTIKHCDYVIQVSKHIKRSGNCHMAIITIAKKNPNWTCSWFGLVQISKLDKNATHQNKQINDKNQENDLNERIHEL